MSLPIQYSIFQSWNLFPKLLYMKNLSFSSHMAPACPFSNLPLKHFSDTLIFVHLDINSLILPPPQTPKLLLQPLTHPPTRSVTPPDTYTASTELLRPQRTRGPLTCVAPTRATSTTSFRSSSCLHLILRVAVREDTAVRVMLVIFQRFFDGEGRLALSFVIFWEIFLFLY